MYKIPKCCVTSGPPSHQLSGTPAGTVKKSTGESKWLAMSQLFLVVTASMHSLCNNEQQQKMSIDCGLSISRTYTSLIPKLPVTEMLVSLGTRLRMCTTVNTMFSAVVSLIDTTTIGAVYNAMQSMVKDLV